MNRKTTLLIAAVIAFLLGWVLPVVDDYRGWQAFRVALSPVWPYESFRFSAWYSATLTVASGLTNVLFMLVLADLLFWRRLSTRAVGWLLVAATLINLHWLARAGAQFTQLAPGYYIWVLAFPILALAAFRR